VSATETGELGMATAGPAPGRIVRERMDRSGTHDWFTRSVTPLDDGRRYVEVLLGLDGSLGRFEDPTWSRGYPDRLLQVSPPLDRVLVGDEVGLSLLSLSEGGVVWRSGGRRARWLAIGVPTPDGSRCILGTRDGIWVAELSRTRVRVVPVPLLPDVQDLLEGGMRPIARVSGDGQRVVVASWVGLDLWTRTASSPVRLESGGFARTGRHHPVAMVGDHGALASWDLWDLGRKTLRWSRRGVGWRLVGIGPRVAVGQGGGALHLVDLATGSVTRRIPVDDAEPVHACFLDDALVASVGPRVHRWTTRSAG